MSEQEREQREQGREPIFLLPGGVTILAGLLIAIHLASTLVLNSDGLDRLVEWFAFQPLRIVYGGEDPSLLVPLLWTPFTHAFLHAGWDHLLLNVAWLVIFATPLTRRYGAGAMITIFLVSAAVGAAFFAVTTLNAGVYLVGASGGVAGLTGAATRFIFQPPIVVRHPETGQMVMVGRKLGSIKETFQNPRSRFFALIWLVLNAAVPLLPMITGSDLSIAWQAHLGGFVAGLLMVGLYERKA